MTAHRTESSFIQCPYCWEKFELIVDCSVEDQEYIEDCEICCRPIRFNIHVDEDGDLTITASNDNE